MASEYITVMTYNVHSCTGRDGKVSPDRIADVIAGCRADIAALQEVDRRLERSSFMDQAGEIARRLNMHHHFHPIMKIERGEYGNAVLSSFPVRLMKASELPTLPGRRNMEKRGALWVEIEAGSKRLQLITTHLGLKRQERLAQAETLLTSEWLDSDQIRGPLVFCGDLNVIPFSRVYRWFGRKLKDAGRPTGRPSRTYPSSFPLLRLDYMFVSDAVTVLSSDVVDDFGATMASDHLPLVVRINLQ